MPQICGKSTHFLSRARIQGSWQVLLPFPAIQLAICTITHPSIPQFLRCPGRPMTQCYSSFGNAGAWVLRLGPRDTTSQTQPASRSSGVRLLRSNPELVAAAQERDKLATCPGSTFYFAPRDLPLVFFGPGGEQSPTSTLASCKCHLRAALPRPCTCTTLRGHHRGTYQPRPPFICPVLRFVASFRTTSCLISDNSCHLASSLNLFC